MKEDFLQDLGIFNTAGIYRNLTPAELTEIALMRGEGILSKTGALVIETGKYTGRSPDDKFIVDVPKIHKKIVIIDSTDDSVMISPAMSPSHS